MKLSRPIALAAVIALSTAACGDGSGRDKASGDSTRTIQIVMRDIMFTPATVDVQRGDKVRFVFTNEGKVAHDAFIGDTDAQAEHEKDMRAGDANAGHDGGHGDSGGITVEPGEKGELTHIFDTTSAVEIGCHQPGHYAGGMKIDVTVA